MNSTTNTYFDTLVHVEGNASFKNNGSGIGSVNGSIAQFDKNLYFSDNGGTNYAETWVNGNLEAPQNTVFKNALHLNGSLSGAANGSSAFQSNVYFSGVSGSVGQQSNVPSSKVSFNNAYLPPLGPMTKFDVTQFPAYAISQTSFSAASIAALGALPDVYMNTSYNNLSTICAMSGATCAPVPSHTVNGVSLPAGYALPAGYYGDLVVDNMTLYLGEGVYYFRSVTLNNTGAKLIGVQPTGGRTIVYADKGFKTTSGGIFVGPDSAVGATGYGSGEGLFMGGTMMVAAGPGSTIQFDSDMKIWATLSSPTGLIQVNSGLTLFGQMFARHFRASNNFAGGNGEFVPFDPEIPTIDISISPEGTIVPEDDKTYYATVTLSHKNAYAVSFKYATAVSVVTADGTKVGTAVAGTNFVDQSTPAIAVIKAGETSVQIPFTIKWDKVFSGNTTFYLDFTSPAGGVFGTGANVLGDKTHVAALVTIVDKDKAPALRISDVSRIEGNAGPGSTDVTFKVEFSDPDAAAGAAYVGTVSRDIAFKWSTKDGTASSVNADFPAQSGTATIAKGATSTTLTVKVNGDLRYEADETFTVEIDKASLSGVLNASAAGMKLVGTGTIVNDDGRPRVVLNDTIFEEGSANSARSFFPYLVDSLTNKPLDATTAPELDVSYTWSTANGTGAGGAIEPEDYSSASGSETIKAGSLRDTIQVTTVGDSRYEPDETFKISIVPGTKAFPKGVDATVTLLNDDKQPILNVFVDSAKGYHEGKPGARDTVRFIIQLLSQAVGNPPITQAEAPNMDVEFDWTTLDNTAGHAMTGTVKDTDYIAAGGHRVIPAGKLADTLKVLMVGDSRYENNETFDVQLSNLKNTAAGSVTKATATILNDDSLPRLKVVTVNSPVLEGNAGTTSLANFKVTLTDPAGVDLSPADAPGVDVTFSWNTVKGTAKDDGTGVAEKDFVRVEAKSETIPAGTLSWPLAVTVNGDGIDEDDETFSVHLIPGTIGVSPNGVFDAATTIQDDDLPPVLTLGGVSKAEGNASTTFPFTATLSTVSARDVTFDWGTQDGTGSDKATLADLDYQQVVPGSGNGRATIKAGSLVPTTTTLNAVVNGDARLENDEIFSIKVTNLKNASFLKVGGKDKDTAFGTILNDDAKPFIKVEALGTVNEKDAPKEMEFKVSLVDSTGKLAAPSALDVTYEWSTVDSVDGLYRGAQASGGDFAAVVKQARTIKAGDLTDILKVTILQDAKDENDESFRVALAKVVGADTNGVKADAKAKGVTTAVGTILDDDAAPVLTVGAASVQEPAKATDDVSLSFPLTLNVASGLPVTVTYFTQASGSTNPATPDVSSTVKRDYEEIASGTVTFAPGETSKTVSVKVHGDDLFEGGAAGTPETLLFKVSAATNTSSYTASTIGSIEDNDAAPILNLVGGKASEKEPVPFTASLRDNSGNLVSSELPVVFKWKVSSGTATAGLDFVDTTGTDTLPAGTKTKTIFVRTLKDNVANEGVETFQVVFDGAPQNAAAGAAGTGSIVDVTAKPVLRINDVTVKEEAGKATFVVTLQGSVSAIPLALTWDAKIAADSAPSKQARPGGTYPNFDPVVAQSATVPMNASSTQLEVTIRDNIVDDPDKLHFWTAFRKANAGDTAFDIGRDLGVGTIEDNDAPPTVNITDTTVNEPASHASSATRARFYVNLTGPSGLDVTGTWTTLDATATSGASLTASPDFKAATGTFRIPAGSLSDSIFVDVLGDSLDENDETFKVKLLTSSNAPVIATDSVGIGTILDEDPLPKFFLRDTAVREPKTGSLTYRFGVYLDRRSAKQVRLTWATTLYPAAGAATPNVDYRDTVGVLTFEPGDTLKNIGVRILADEPVNVGNETVPYGTGFYELFKVALSPVANVDIGRNEAVDTILDNDGKPFVSIDSQTINEQDGTLDFHLSMDIRSAVPVTIPFSTSDVTTSAGLDYEARSGSVVIDKDLQQAVISVKIKDDLLDENTETFQLNLLPSGDVNYLNTVGVGTIVDNDAEPVVSVLDAAKQEPAVAGVSDTMQFRVRLSAPSGLPVTVKWNTRAGTAQSSLAPIDYQDSGNTLVLRPGLVDTTVAVRILGDSLYEGDETFSVVLTEATGAAVSSVAGTALGTIQDNDLAPRLHIDDKTVREGDTARFVARLERESGLPVTFSWNTLDGTAKAGSGDYKDAVGSVTVPAGSKTVVLEVRALTDNVSGEGAETFRVALTNLVGASIGRDTGNGTILDTNALPSLLIDNLLGIHEADTTVHFTVSLVGAPGAKDIAVKFSTHEGTATPGLRYVDTSGTVIIPAGATSVRIPVRILDDSIYEPVPEHFAVVLDAVDSARLVQRIGLGEIVDDGDLPVVRLRSAEGMSEGGTSIFQILLEGSSKDSVKIWWRTIDSTGKDGLDYTGTSGMTTVLPGSRTSSVSVGTLADNIWEPTEFFKVRIDSVKGAGLAVTDSVALGTILDVGEIPAVTFLSPDTSVMEDASDSVLVRLGLTRPSSVDLKVALVRQGGTAIYGVDYTTAVDTVLFKANDSLASFKVHVAGDTTDENDESAGWSFEPPSPIRTGDKALYTLTILDDDSTSTVRFDTSFLEIVEGDSVILVAKLDRASGKDAAVWFRSGGTATEGVDDDRVSGARYVFRFKAGETTARAIFHTREDRIHEGTEFMAFEMDSLENLALDTLRDTAHVSIVDNDEVPLISFVVRDTTVSEAIGSVVVGLRLSNPSSTATTIFVDAAGRNATLDSLAMPSDAVLKDERYQLIIPAGDTAIDFGFRILDDGRVEPTETFVLKISSKEANPKDPDSLGVHILDNDHGPVVKITSPAEGAKLGGKDLNVLGKVPATWTLDGSVQAPFDTLLPEGNSTIVKCYTDLWGNTGCDSVHVNLDLTPPTVVITDISKDGGKSWIAVGPNDTPWVNVPDLQVKWISIDDGDTTRYQDGETLKDSLNTLLRSDSDAVGNVGIGKALVGLDTVAPVAVIVTPPAWSHWSAGCINGLWTEQDGSKVVRHDTLLCFKETGVQTITVCTEPDRAGNVGCATRKIVIDPNTPSSAVYVDSDHDGRIDQVVLQFPRTWSDEMPSFDISYGGPGRNTQSGLTASYGTADQIGRTMVVGGETVRVVTGTPVLDGSGMPVLQADGTPLYQSKHGTALLDSTGRQLTDAQGVPLWKLTGTSGAAVDSSVLVVKLDTPFPFGWTSSTLTDLGVLTASTTVRDSSGALVKTVLKDTFDIRDGVAPVILASTIVRTESYEGKDTLTIQLSETADLGKGAGTGLFEISTDGGLTWVPVDAESVDATGAIRIVLEPGAPGTPKPGMLIRIAGNVTDASGNVATSATSPADTVKGLARPDLVKVTGPSNLLEITKEDGLRPLNGPMAFLATREGSTVPSAYKPGTGYVDASEVTSVCPDLRLCATTTLYINRASSVEMFIYDQLGTYVAKTSFVVSKADLAMIEKDKLDRARLQIVWNLRDSNNRQVNTGVYLVRMLIRYNDDSNPGAKMENFILRYGVKVR